MALKAGLVGVDPKYVDKYNRPILKDLYKKVDAAVRAHIYEKTVTGNPISISDAIGVAPSNVTLTLNPIQAGSGEPSPTNVRAISGRSSVALTVNSDTETISLGQTVYGGVLDVTSGELTSDMAILTYTGASDEQWEYADLVSSDQFYIIIPTALDMQTLYANEFEIITMADRPTKTGVVMNTDKLLRVSILKSEGISSVNAWKTWLSNHNLVVCYKLDTPTTVSLTPTDIDLLRGINNISSVDGNCSISITYKGINKPAAAAGNRSLNLSIIDDPEEIKEDLKDDLKEIKEELKEDIIEPEPEPEPVKKKSTRSKKTTTKED